MPVTDDAAITDILNRVRSIAVVGASPNPARPSFGVTRVLVAHGYDVFPVNPGHGGGEIAGLKAYATLADLPQPVDMIDVFRASEHVSGVLDEVLAMDPRPSVLWTQLGVLDHESAARAEAEGLTVVMDRCPAIEISRETGIPH
ncbi:CoA-binding protein [Chelatococcus sambhunathii]|uniref:CoA-binding protein n=1 Tax=Chelatococcus sambhunathii TaxID=363953 RepID=A0ABU1DB45_9HYPH|nr:CoA-binding protein [Chelatococcus sambhunathii]MDR4305333.1 CoA-binding protein [Chelatococcus sambhunathii]